MGHRGNCFEDAYILGIVNFVGCMIDYMEVHKSVSSWKVSKLAINVEDAAG